MSFALVSVLTIHGITTTPLKCPTTFRKSGIIRQTNFSSLQSHTSVIVLANLSLKRLFVCFPPTSAHTFVACKILYDPCIYLRATVVTSPILLSLSPTFLTSIVQYTATICSLRKLGKPLSLCIFHSFKHALSHF